MKNGWVGRVILGGESVLFVGAGGTTPLHQHLAHKLVIGLDRPVKVLDANGAGREGRILLVLAGEKHQVLAEGARVGLYYSDAGTAHSSTLPLASDIRALVSLCRRVDRTGVEMIAPLVAAVKLDGYNVLDSRISRAVALLRQRDAVKLGVIASQLGLSRGRLTHLFTSLVGGAPVSYRRWRRLWLAAEMLGRGVRVVDAALDSGFSDSAHLTRTFKEMLGITPGELQKSEMIVSPHFAGHVAFPRVVFPVARGNVGALTPASNSNA